MTQPGIREQIHTVQAEYATRPAGLMRHVERVVAEAVALASYYGADPERVELAAWGHDLFRAHKPGELLQLAREAGVLIADEDVAEPVLLHGPIAAVVLRERFAIHDEDALAAVRDHTLGLDRMSIIAKIILIADKVEPRKRDRTPAMKAIRKLARRDIDTALLCWADWKWVEEREHGWHSSPQHWTARVEWVREHHIDVGLPLRVSARTFKRAADAAGVV
ncbi:MAG: bis(5'-nucleosyl)-tetraphosphatase (symmetrical) YqeK [Tepidiformaceae bacterium]